MSDPTPDQDSQTALAGLTVGELHARVAIYRLTRDARRWAFFKRACSEIPGDLELSEAGKLVAAETLKLLAVVERRIP